MKELCQASDKCRRNNPQLFSGVRWQLHFLGEPLSGILPISERVSISIRKSDTACDNSDVRAGASPSQNGIPGG